MMHMVRQQLTPKNKTADTSMIRDRLRESMDARNMNCIQLANAAGVRTSFLYDILSGKSVNPSVVHLSKVATALQVNLSYLAGAYGLNDKSAPDNRFDASYTVIPMITYDQHSDHNKK